MKARDVIITGAGLVTSLGNNVEENWHNLNAMNTGILHYPKDDAPAFLTYAGKVSNLETSGDISPKLLSQMKFLNRGSLLGFASAREAVSQCKIQLSTIPPERRALYIGSGDFTKVGYDFMFQATKDGTGGKWEEMDYERLNRSTLDTVNPFFLLESIYNNLFSFLSAYFEFMGPNTSLASLSPCGGQAIEHAYRSIKQGKADIAMAVGSCSWISELSLYELEGLGILSRCRDGAGSFRPFDRSRDGFIAGEGGAALFLESSETARERGAEPIGILKGFGDCMEFSPGHGIEVPPEVSRRSITMALDEAGIKAGELACMIPHGSGTRKGDRSELHSVHKVISHNKQDVPVCALKPYTGHMGAASDIAEIILGLKAVKNGTVPATLNFQETESEFTDLRISGKAQQCEKSHFVSVSYGIGGQSSSVVVCTDTG